MKLHLSSYKIPNLELFEELVGMSASEMKLGVIVNASDSRPDRNERLDRFEKELRQIGFQDVERLDLTGFNQQSLRTELMKYDVVHALGGNSFDLREAMRSSGFDDVIHQLLDVDFVYSGDSAGAIVMGPSLAGFQSMDEAGPDAATDGVGIVDVVIVPHNDSPKEKYRGRWPAIQKANPGCRVLPLNDNQAYVIDGERREVVTV